jgi:hypothetical protein
MRPSRLVLAAACVAALSHPLAAQDAAPQPAAAQRLTVGGLIAELKASREGVRRKVVNVDTTNSAFIFPAAGSVQGAGGTFFKSDAMLANYRASAQNVHLGFLAQGVNNSSRPVVPISLLANTATPYTDIVTTTLGETGLGAILVSGVLSSGNADTNASLDGFSRIYTPQPGASGTVSLAFPSFTALDSFGNVAAYALGMRHDTAFRANVGIVNLDDSARTFNVSAIGTGGTSNFTVTVEAISMRQVPVPSGNLGSVLVSVVPTVNGFWWSAYAASVDNITGDGWVSHASQP